MKIGKIYHIFNCYANTFEFKWIRNAKLTKIHEYSCGLKELEFNTLTGKTFVLDNDFILPFDTDKNKKGFMYIEINE